jgi:hypothetical protein
MNRIFLIVVVVLTLMTFAPMKLSSAPIDQWMTSTSSVTSEILVSGRTAEDGATVQEVFFPDSTFALGGVLVCGQGALLFLSELTLQQLQTRTVIPAVRVVADLDRAEILLPGVLTPIPDQPFTALLFDSNQLDALLEFLLQAEWATFEFATLNPIGGSLSVLRHRVNFQPEGRFVPCD